MKIIADTNVLLRALLGDDLAQQEVATEALESADPVAISAQSLCELAWVVRRTYNTAGAEIAILIRRLRDMRNVVFVRPALEAGLAVLDAGGDFADGVIAYDGKWLGGETFVSFDKRAVALVAKPGQQARRLGE